MITVSEEEIFASLRFLWQRMKLLVEPSAAVALAPLLSGRSARVLITSDTPRAFLWLAYRDAILRQLKGQILGFCGFRPVQITFFAPASHPKPGAVEKLLEKMDKLGRAGR